MNTTPIKQSRDCKLKKQFFPENPINVGMRARLYVIHKHTTASVVGTCGLRTTKIELFIGRWLQNMYKT